LIRKAYLDFIKNKVTEGRLVWLLKRGVQYLLIHMSFLVKRPLCGPVLATLVTNYSCNYRCRMCDLPLRDKAMRDKGLDELTTSQLKTALKDFADLGASGVGFTGGEPLIREDIFELLGYAKDLDMITHLNTNGFFLDEEAAKKLIGCKVDSINVSLDGASEKTHDNIRGHDGAFRKAVNAVGHINRLRATGGHTIRVKIVSVISPLNIDEIPGLVRLSAELGTDCIEFIPEQPFSAAYDVKMAHDQLFLGKLNKAVSYLLDLKKKGANIENSPRHLKLFEKSFRNAQIPFRCYAGYNSYAVDCYGEIYPCVPWFNWNRAVGNMRDVGFKDFWYSRGYNKMRGDILKCRGCYLNCQAELNLLFNARIGA